ncbi:MAG: DeoR/GlpR transcriptional regulator [Paenibacillaceae bacterium]|nr:DeoR/GlpR transcriptional regulator [Paenibacillaceae bacterium]
MGTQALSKGQQRREQMLSLIKRQSRVTLQEIVDHCGCSEATARRDLGLLEESGDIIRTIGGAQIATLPYEGNGYGKESSFDEKKQLLWNEKLAIAERAAALIEEGDVIGLTGGTTTYLIAKAIKHREGITVVTNAVNIAMELADSDGVQVVLTGGVMRSKSFELCGPLARKTVEDIHIGKMFLGSDGISARQGVTTYSELEAEISQMLVERAAMTIAVFDHSKAGKASLFTVVPLASLQACVTDGPLDAELERRLAELGVVVHQA